MEKTSFLLLAQHHVLSLRSMLSAHNEEACSALPRNSMQKERCLAVAEEELGGNDRTPTSSVFEEPSVPLGLLFPFGTGLDIIEGAPDIICQKAKKKPGRQTIFALLPSD
ncbi:hypothetical protein QOT17_008540 [Balamuthia mandrillaris]